MTPEDAAEALALKPRRVILLLKGGKLPGVKLGRQWRVDAERLEQQVRGEPEPSEPDLNPDEAELFEQLGRHLLSHRQPILDVLRLAERQGEVSASAVLDFEQSGRISDADRRTVARCVATLSHEEPAAAEPSGPPGQSTAKRGALLKRLRARVATHPGEIGDLLAYAGARGGISAVAPVRFHLDGAVSDATLLAAWDYFAANAMLPPRQPGDTA